MSSFGVVIVTWNSEEVIGTCVDACLAIPGAEVLVVDNASADQTVAAVRRRARVRVIENPVNRGFAGGANDGISALQTGAVLLLNPDAIPLEGIGKLREAVLMPGAGAVGGRLEDRSGNAQDGFNVRSFPTAWTLSFEVLGINRLFPWNPVNTRYRLKLRGNAIREVDQPAGAFLMVNREAWAKVGGFDESFYPVWFEDVDFCWRLRKHGYRVMYHPGASARHIGGHSATRMNWGRRRLCWYESLLRYAARHFRPEHRRAVAAAVMLACAPRGLLDALVGNGAEAVTVYRKVFRLALCCWRKSGLFSELPAGPSSSKGETGTAFLR
jgi:GT2 family glycosyltransferase